MDVVEIRGGKFKGKAIRRDGVGFAGCIANFLAFEVGFEVFKHGEDGNGVVIYFGPFGFFVGWFKRPAK